MTKLLLALFFALGGCLTTLGQDRGSRFSVQVGYLKSHHHLADHTKGFLIGRPALIEKPGFCVGIQHLNPLGKRLLLRTGLTYQNRSVYRMIGMPGQRFKRLDPHHIIGVAPTIGVTSLRNLRVFVGPAFNFPLDNDETGRYSQPVEIGAAATSSYSLGKIDLMVGYFRGLTPFTKTSRDIPYFSVFNQHWQLGLLFNIHSF